MFSVLHDKLVVTENGKASGSITSEGRCMENATSIPISVYSLFPLSVYCGCGEWKSDSGEEFKLYHMEGDESYVTFMSNFGELTFNIINSRKDTIKIGSLEEVMDDRAVFYVTDDGWKIVDIFIFDFKFPDMTGFNTYAYKDNHLCKCKVEFKDCKPHYTIFE